jgi:ABC-type uncharacterized transport system substrate-binding protein
MKFLIALLVMLFVTGFFSPALAHPHIFARYNVTITPAEKGFIKLHFTFTFQGVANPVITPGVVDTVQLDKDMLANLAAHPFFLYLDMDGQSIGQQTVHLVPVKSDGKEQVYEFDLELPDSMQNFGFALYDPTYFDSVWQTDANSVVVKWDKIACTAQEEKVGKTVWGILRAQYVQCANKSGPRPPPHSFKNLPPMETPGTPANQPDSLGRQMVP